VPSDRTGDYEVGYKKPPKETRFKKGKSGNPRGRPHGSKNLATLLGEALDTPITVVEDGARRQRTKRDVVIAQLVDQSAGADLRATKLLLDMLQRLERGAVPAHAETASSVPDAEVYEQLRAKLARLALAQEAKARAVDPPQTFPRLGPIGTQCARSLERTSCFVQLPGSQRRESLASRFRVGVIAEGGPSGARAARSGRGCRCGGRWRRAPGDDSVARGCLRSRRLRRWVLRRRDWWRPLDRIKNARRLIETLLSEREATGIASPHRLGGERAGRGEVRPGPVGRSASLEQREAPIELDPIGRELRTEHLRACAACCR